MTNTFDINIINYFYNHLQCGFFDFVLKIFTYLGEAGIIWIAIGIILVITKKYRKTGFMLLIGLLVGVVVGNLFLKNLIARPRPYVELNLALKIAEPGKFSFPSGHTLSSFIGATILVLNNKKTWVWAYPLATMIAISRIYFAVHYLTDIIGGIILGVTIAVLVKATFDTLTNIKLKSKFSKKINIKDKH